MVAQRALEKLCKEFTSVSGKQTIVGFGDWSATDNGGVIKKTQCGPVKKLEKRLRLY